MQLCKNPRCTRIVPPSRNKGRERLFCSMRCQRRYHSLQYYYRQREAEKRDTMD